MESRCRQTLCVLFEVGEQLQEMIKQECQRRITDVISFVRYAVVVAMHSKARPDNGAVS